MFTKSVSRRGFSLLCLLSVCGLALSISGCGSKSDEARKPDDQTTQQMRKNKKDD